MDFCISCSVGVAVLDCWCPRSLFSRAGVPPPRRRVSQSPVISSHTARESAAIDNQPPATVSTSECVTCAPSVPSPSSPILALSYYSSLDAFRHLPAVRSHIKSTRHASVQIIPLNIVPNPLNASQKFIPFSPHIPAISLSITPPPSPSHYFHISNIPSPA